MPRQYTTSKHLGRLLAKLQKKDKKLYENLLKKMDEVLNSRDIEPYKNLKYDLKQYKRVHVDGSVLLFKYDKERDFIYFDDFDHHDEIYDR